MIIHDYFDQDHFFKTKESITVIDITFLTKNTNKLMIISFYFKMLNKYNLKEFLKSLTMLKMKIIINDNQM